MFSMSSNRAIEKRKTKHDTRKTRHATFHPFIFNLSVKRFTTSPWLMRKVCFFVFFCWSCMASAQDCHVALRGTITESDTGQPLAFATVTVTETGAKANTDERGRYAIVNHCEGMTYTVVVDHVACTHTTQVVKLKEGLDIDIQLLHQAVLHEVVVKEKATVLANTTAEQGVNQRDLSATQGVNLGETLKRIPGVALLNTGATIAKPIIQGLHSNRIAIVNDAVNLESQQWGADHAPEIDPFSAGQIRVVKGAAGVRYGINAIGGAVVLDPAPLRETAGWGGWATLQGVSNGRGGVAAAAADWRSAQRNLALRVQMSAKRTGNLRAPDYWLGNTGLAELHGNATVGWQKNGHKHRVTASRFGQQIGILRSAHSGNTTDLRLAVQSDTPRNNRNWFQYGIERPYQAVQHYTAKYEIERSVGEKWKLTAQYSVQYNDRREYDVLRSTSRLTDRPQVSFQLTTNQINAAMEHFPIRHWQGGMGIQLLQQINFVGRGGYIPDYQTWGGGVWLMERWRRFPIPFEVEFGLRYDYRLNRVSYAPGTFLPPGRSRDTTVRFHNPAAVLGVLYHIGKKGRIGLNSGYTTRPPHVYESFARGVHFATATYEEGNRALRTERAWNTNLNFTWEHRRTSLTLTLYRNQISNFIYLQPRDSGVLTVRGSFQAFDYRQNNAVLHGLDIGAEVPMGKTIYAEAQASFVRGQRYAIDRERSTAEWLPLMPTDRLRYGLRWEPSEGRFIRLSALTIAEQTRFTPQEVRLKAMPKGVTLLNLEAAHWFTIHQKKMELGLSIQNLLNERYRENTDFFRFFADAPGRNVVLRGKILI
jgi:iron complex outermembrane recepter protein